MMLWNGSDYLFGEGALMFLGPTFFCLTSLLALQHLPSPVH